MLTRSQLKKKIADCCTKNDNPVFGPTTRTRAKTIQRDITEVMLPFLVDVGSAPNIQPVTLSQGKNFYGK